MLEPRAEETIVAAMGRSWAAVMLSRERWDWEDMLYTKLSGWNEVRKGEEVDVQQDSQSDRYANRKHGIQHPKTPRHPNTPFPPSTHTMRNPKIHQRRKPHRNRPQKQTIRGILNHHHPNLGPDHISQNRNSKSREEEDGVEDEEYYGEIVEPAGLEGD